MLENFEDFKGFITYCAGLLGIVLTWGGLGSFIILILTCWYTIMQIKSHKSKKRVAELEAKKLELEIEILEQSKPKKRLVKKDIAK